MNEPRVPDQSGSSHPQQTGAGKPPGQNPANDLDRAAGTSWQQRLRQGLDEDLSQLDPKIRQRLAQARQQALTAVPEERAGLAFRQVIPWAFASALGASVLAVIFLPHLSIQQQLADADQQGTNNAAAAVWDELNLLAQEDFPLIAFPLSASLPNQEHAPGVTTALDESFREDENDDELAFYTWVETELNGEFGIETPGVSS